MLKVNVIVNPNAQRTPNGIGEKIEAILSPVCKLEIFETKNIAELRECIRKNPSADVWALVGGDGTITATLTELWFFLEKPEMLPLIFPLKGGTMNLVANNVPLRGDFDDLLVRFRDFLENTKSPKDIMRDNIKRINTIFLTIPEMEIRTLCFSFALGVPYKITKKFYTLPKKNVRSAMQLLYSSIAKFVVGRDTEKLISKIKAKIEIDGQVWPYDEHYLIVGSVFSRLVLFFKPFCIDDKWKRGFNFLVYSGDAWTALRNFRQYAMGKRRAPHSYNDLAENVKIETSEGINFDGELYEYPKTYHIIAQNGAVANILKI